MSLEVEDRSCIWTASGFGCRWTPGRTPLAGGSASDGESLKSPDHNARIIEVGCRREVVVEKKLLRLRGVLREREQLVLATSRSLVDRMTRDLVGDG